MSDIRDKRITILMPVHNEKKLAELAVKFLRMNLPEGDFPLVLIDNASDDGLREWAASQQDLTYVYMDQGMEPWGSVLQQVIDGLEIRTDLMIMQCRYIPIPGCMERMLDVFCSDLSPAAVSCEMTESTIRQQRTAVTLSEYEETVDYAGRMSGRAERVMGFDGCFFFLRYDALTQIGGFDPSLFSLRAVIRDISLGLLYLGLKMVICHNAVVLELPTEFPEHMDSLIHMEEDEAYLRKKRNIHYMNLFGNGDIIDIIDIKNSSDTNILEIGCDCGATLLMLKERYPLITAVGCDISAAATDLASHVLDRAFVANIEDESLPLTPGSLDMIIFADVLEHLHDPLRTLRYVKSFLKPDGRIVASIPNLMHISVMRGLLHGDFTYTEMGLLDRTHIHMFTWNEIVRIFDAAEMEIELRQDRCIDLSVDDHALIEHLLELAPSAERFMYETFQYQIRAVAQKHSDTGSEASPADSTDAGFEALGDSLFSANIKQAFLCYQRALYASRTADERDRLHRKLEQCGENGGSVPKTAIVIVSYGQRFLLQKCIESIREYCDPETYSIIVVDNGSDNDTVRWLKEQDNIILRCNNENAGFPAACNQGIELSSPDEDIFLLNNDTRLTPDALFWLRMGLYQDEKTGAAGCISNYAGKGQIRDIIFDTPEQYVEYGAKNNRLMSDPYREQGFLCGFAFLIRRDVLRLTGNLDERFSPGYYEDTDLSLRITAAGYKLLICENSFIYHAGSQSFRKREDLEELMERNLQYLVSKWGAEQLQTALGI
ncbi:MAG: glycosyltransferase [Lachnospiraceae bacterium]|nr:glycosyltransferase [Lachnospiraceae bacterium]